MTTVSGIVCGRYPQLLVKATPIHHYSPRLFTFPTLSLCKTPPQHYPHHGSISCQREKNAWRVISASPMYHLPIPPPLTVKLKQCVNTPNAKATFTSYSMSTKKPSLPILFPTWNGSNW